MSNLFYCLYAVEDGPSSNVFRPSRLRHRRSHEETNLNSMEYPSDEDIRESGAGILEFTPAKAGMDMTPANFDFESKDDKKRTTAGLSCLAGILLSNLYKKSCGKYSKINRSILKKKHIYKKAKLVLRKS